MRVTYSMAVQTMGNLQSLSLYVARLEVKVWQRDHQPAVILALKTYSSQV